jgi:hypothetical protein
MSDDIKYEYKSVQAVRGMENRSIAKTQEEGGWELVDQTQGMLRTTLNFRRVKPETSLSKAWNTFRGLAPAKQRALAVAVAVFLPLAAVGIGIAAAQDKGNTNAGNTTTQATESTAIPSPSPTEAAVMPTEPAKIVPAETESASEQILTVENNEDLAVLLADVSPDLDKVEGFAAKYKGRTIEFDGNIASMSNHGSYKTRYDILVYAGNYSKISTIGPNFQFKDVNIVSDLHLTGANIPDTLGVGRNLHIVASVEGFNRVQELFFLKPISTEVR